MSTGIVICSKCSRELHQNGNREVENGWKHCEDRTPRCVGATTVYSDSEANIKGKWCGCDRAESLVASGGSYVELDRRFVAPQGRKFDQRWLK